MVKNPPVMGETWVQTLGREDPLEEGSVLAILFVMTVGISLCALFIDTRVGQPRAKRLR